MFGCVWAGLGILFVWAYREVLAWYPFLPHRCGLVSGGYFPSFWEGLSLRQSYTPGTYSVTEFPFLLGGTFIEACFVPTTLALPSHIFPFLLGGTFIEAVSG